jgi:Ca2+-binding EF-hand superfamily protein
MNSRLRKYRSAFLAFLAAEMVALFAAMPLAAQQQAVQMKPAAPQQESRQQHATVSRPPSASSQFAPQFEEADRNKDGSVDKSEAGVVPGLSANFERADRNKDGKLDKEEFARGLDIVVGHK